MEVAQFNKLIEEQIEDIRTRSGSKNAEYARGGDKLYNFKRAASVMGVSVEEAHWGMFMKHFISTQDIVEDIEDNKYSTRELIDEKIGDAIVYLILLKAILIDQGHVKSVIEVANMTAAIDHAWKGKSFEPHVNGHEFDSIKLEPTI